MSIFRKLLLWLDDATYVWRQELKHVFRDEGVLMFCIVVPLGYPLLYSWIYNNEGLLCRRSRRCEVARQPSGGEGHLLHP